MRKEIKAKLKVKDFIYKNENLQNYSPPKMLLRVTKQEGLI